MNTIDLFNFIEENKSYEFERFVDLHIFNNQVIGFYKTNYVVYQDKNEIAKSYLFPTTFEIVNNTIKTIMVFGTVERNFQVEDVNGIGGGTVLKTLSIGNHIYKLLVAEQFMSEKDKENNFHINGFHLKNFIAIIESLSMMKFPFIRITNNDSIKKYSEI